MQFPCHRELQDKRLCGATTMSTGLNTKVMVNNTPAAVEGDLDDHNMLGALMPIDTKVMIGGIKAVPSIISMAQTDVLGLIPHITGLPIPITGSPNVFIGQGTGSAGIGMMQPILGALGQTIGFSPLQVGELVSVAGQVMGMVQNFTQIGGGAAVSQMTNLQGAPLSSGSVVTGQTSGATFTYINYFDSRVATQANTYPAVESVANALVTDSGDYIVIKDYDDYPNMNLTASVITT